MRDVTEILEDIKKYDDIPSGYDLLEMYAYLNLRRIILMYQNNQLSKEKANNLKQRVEAQYYSMQKEYQFRNNLFDMHVKNITKTENLRIKLRKKLKENSKETEELLKIAIELVQLYSGEVFE